MLIGILETGRPAPELVKTFGTYGDMTAHLLADGATIGFRRYWLPDGEFPAAADECDGWVITGSRSSVTEEQGWMLRLEALLRDMKTARRPVVGICFGHQILAKAMGGEVREAPEGWQLGLLDYRLTERPSWLEGAPEELRINAIHQDQVLSVPPGGRLLATASGCPIAALLYDDWAVSFQAHPEFSIGFEKALLSSIAGDRLPEGPAKAALAGLDKADAASDAALIGRGLRRFLQQAYAFRR